MTLHDSIISQANQQLLVQPLYCIVVYPDLNAFLDPQLLSISIISSLLSHHFWSQVTSSHQPIHSSPLPSHKIHPHGVGLGPVHRLDHTAHGLVHRAKKLSLFRTSQGEP